MQPSSQVGIKEVIGMKSLGLIKTILRSSTMVYSAVKCSILGYLIWFVLVKKKSTLRTLYGV